jgi:serine/threonine protein kinase
MGIPRDLADVAALLCGQRDYSLIAELGAGAHKRAYLIAHREQHFALKIAPITPSLKPRFEREAAALCGCAHPAIAVLHESSAFLHDGQEFWISIEEYLAGGTLAERLKAGTLEVAFIRRMALALAGALQHLSDRHLVHRDIKPANILFRPNDEAVLTDFGIVRMLEAPTLTQDFLPQGPGTPLYAAAEQLLNEKALIDWRTDQFGLALVIAQTAIGIHPFAPENDLPLAVARVARRQSMPTDCQDKLRAAGFGALIKALSPWPAQRYRLPSEFIEALSAV